MPQQASYKVGCVVSIPLPRGGYGLAVVARRAPVDKRTSKIFCYGLNIVQETPQPVQPPAMHEAIMVSSGGDGSITSGRWTVVGNVADVQEWIVPPMKSLRLPGRPHPLVASDQRLLITNDATLRVVNTPNTDLIDEAEYGLLPMFTGLGDSVALEKELERAIRDRDPRLCIRVDGQTLERWHDVLSRARAQGVYPLD